MKANKVSIVGAGLVGSTIAYTLSALGTASRIVLVDIDHKRAEGEAMDIEHGSPSLKEVDIQAGDYADTADSDIVIITAGTNQRPGETRMDLITRNASIMRNVASEVAKYSPNALLLIISNPVDVMTRVAQEVSGFPAERVIGSGTNLDSARFRHILSEKFGIDSHNVHCYILGEHGDSEFAAWSLVNIAGMNINEASDKFGGVMQDMDYLTIADDVRNAAYKVIDRKGATYYGIAASATRICEALLRDEKSIIPVSVKLNGEYGINDVYLSLPAVVGRAGVLKVVAPNLSDEEQGKLRASAQILSDAYNKVRQ